MIETIRNKDYGDLKMKQNTKSSHSLKNTHKTNRPTNNSHHSSKFINASHFIISQLMLWYLSFFLSFLHPKMLYFLYRLLWILICTIKMFMESVPIENIQYHLYMMNTLMIEYLPLNCILPFYLVFFLFSSV